MSKFELFLVALDEPIHDTDHLAEWLDAEERTHWARFEREDLRRRYVVAHAALRLVLARVLGRRPAEIEFHRNAWGRPETSDGPSFNMSHSGARALIAVAENGPVGVDMEAGDKRLSTEVFDAVTSDAERRAAAGRRLERDDRLRLWVRKEAVLKALGRGLSFPPHALTVGAHARDVVRRRRVTVMDECVRRDFSLIDLSLPFRLLGALAMGGDGGDAGTIDIERLTI